jgi:hypothetical protein
VGVMGKFRSSDRYPGGNHPCVHHAFRKGKFHSLSVSGSSNWSRHDYLSAIPAILPNICGVPSEP